MKKLILITCLFFGIAGVAFAQFIAPNQCNQIPCDNQADCQMQAQCLTDASALVNAQIAVQNDLAAYQGPAQQAIITAQLAKTQTALSSFSANSTVSTNTASPATH